MLTVTICLSTPTTYEGLNGNWIELEKVVNFFLESNFTSSGFG